MSVRRFEAGPVARNTAPASTLVSAYAKLDTCSLSVVNDYRSDDINSIKENTG